MAKPGPKTTPTALKRKYGNPGKRKLPENEVKPYQAEKVPPPPKHLDKEARKFWRKYAKVAHTNGLLTEMDIPAFGSLCSHYSIWLDALGQIQKHGVLIIAQSGFPMQSPYLQIANKSMAEMRKWLTEFGMTPSSRAGMKVENPKPKSKAELFRDRKRGAKT